MRKVLVMVLIVAGSNSWAGPAWDSNYQGRPSNWKFIGDERQKKEWSEGSIFVGSMLLIASGVMFKQSSDIQRRIDSKEKMPHWKNAQTKYYNGGYVAAAMFGAIALTVGISLKF